MITPPPPARDDLTGAQGLANARALRETGDIPRQIARHDGRVDCRRENVSLHLAVPVAAIDLAYEQVPFEVAQRDGGRRRAADRERTPASVAASSVPAGAVFGCRRCWGALH